MRDEVFILSTGPIDRLGGMERFLQYLASGFEQRGFGVRVFHCENTGPAWHRHGNPKNKIARVVADGLHGFYIGRAAKAALHPGVRLVLSNSTVGWYPLGRRVKHAHFFHGTYRGQAEAVRPFIKRLGYLKLKWWDAMVLERFSGMNNIALCCSEPIRAEIERHFGYGAQVMWYPIDLRHFQQLDIDACRRRIGVESNRVGLYVGSCHPMKGFGAVEHIARAFPDMTMLIAVRGPLSHGIFQLPNVRVFQDAPYDLLPALYNAADFSVCPSRYDPFPFAMAEALASGTPVIASPHGASLTFYDDPLTKPLLTASADDLAGFEKAVRRILSEPPKWRDLIKKVVRPRLYEMMAPENWWRRFLEVTGLR